MKISQLLSIVTLFVLLAPYFSFAQFPPPENVPLPDIPSSLFSCSPVDSLRRCMLRLLGDILRVILVIALAFAAIFIAWAGIEYILKGSGEAKDREKMKNRIIYAAVGLVVAFLAWVLAVLIQRIVTGGAPAI